MIAHLTGFIASYLYLSIRFYQLTAPVQTRCPEAGHQQSQGSERLSLPLPHPSFLQ
jgi:hypothetical protein